MPPVCESSIESELLVRKRGLAPNRSALCEIYRIRENAEAIHEASDL